MHMTRNTAGPRDVSGRAPKVVHLKMQSWAARDHIELIQF
jgi:hypothetical protein